MRSKRLKSETEVGRKGMVSFQPGTSTTTVSEDRIASVTSAHHFHSTESTMTGIQWSRGKARSDVWALPHYFIHSSVVTSLLDLIFPVFSFTWNIILWNSRFLMGIWKEKNRIVGENWAKFLLACGPFKSKWCEIDGKGREKSKYVFFLTWYQIWS